VPPVQDFRHHVHLFSSPHDRGHGLWLTEAGYHRHLTPKASHDRVRPDWTLLLSASGAGFARLGARQSPLEPGDLLILPPGRMHTYGCTGPWSSVFVHFDGPRAALLAARIAGSPWPVVRLRRPAPVWRLAGKLLRLCATRTVRLQPAAASVLDEMLIEIADAWEAARPKGDPASAGLVPAVHGWLLDRLERKLTVRQIAAHAGYSPAYFSRVWKSRTGHAPVDYLTELRLQKAREALVLTTAPVGAIAQRVGFDDALYFSKLFRARIGLAPTEYRRRSAETGQRRTDP
jgi:AraC-like DNA-binding protein